MNKKERLIELEKQRKERLEKYSADERKTALDNLLGCFSDIKEFDFSNIGVKATSE